MIQEIILFLFRLWALLMLSVLLGSPEAPLALEAIDTNELQYNSPALKPGQKDLQSDASKHSEKDAEQSIKPISTTDTNRKAMARRTEKGLSEEVFHLSVCIQCHGQNTIQPADRTRKQWRLLIEKDGHSVIKPIQWSTPEEKQVVLEFLLNHAKDNLPKSEGIGVWK